MRYCKFESYMHGDPPTNWDKDYISPMFGDNGLYNKVPLDATPVYLLSTKTVDEEKYGDLEQCVDAILNALEIDALPMLSFGAAYMSPLLGDVIDDPNSFFRMCASMCGYNGKYNVYTPGWRFYAVNETSDIGVGNIDLSNGYMACFAFMQVIGEHPTGGANYAFIQNIADADRFVYIFDVFPYDVFRTGKFDFSVMKEGVAHPGDTDWKRYATIRLEIWEEEDGDAVVYNCNAQIYGTDVNIYGLNDFYQDKKTQVYNSGTPLPDANPKDEPPGSGGRPTDNIPFPSLPGSDMTSSGSLRVYTLSAAQVKQLFDYLHSHDPAASVLKWWSNPMQAIISLHYLPYAMRHKGNTEEFTVLGTPTGIQGFQPAEQFQEINFGYSDLELDSGSYLDYSPYTKVSIYLPGIGIRELNTDDVMNKRIWVRYHCDNVTGQFVAFIAVGTKNSSENNVTVRYAYSGSVAASFPITQENWGNTYIAAATLAAGALAVGVTAGAAAAAGGGAAAGEAAGTAAGAAEAGASGGASAANVAGGAVSIGNSLSNLAKPSVSRSGAVSGTTSLFAVKRPYLIIESPDWYDYKDEFAGIKGWPYGLYQDFNKLKGYAVVEGCHLHGITATVGELNEIEALLKSGVIF